MLTDKQIKDIILEGKFVDLDNLLPEEKQDLFASIGPCSLDVRLGHIIYIEKPPYPVTQNELEAAICKQNINIFLGETKPHPDWVKIRDSQTNPFQPINISSTSPENPYLLRPKSFILGATTNVFMFPDNLAGSIVLRSTWGRRGLNHAFCGLCDAGVGNHPDPDKRGIAPTLELINELQYHVLPIYFGAKIAQIVLQKTDEAPMKPYWMEGHYGLSETKPILSRQYEQGGEF